MPVDKRAISHVYFSSGSIKPFIKNGNDILNVSSTKEAFQNFTKSFFASHESHVKRPFILDRASHHSTTYYIAQHKCWMEILQCKALSDIAYVSEHICEFIRLYLGSNTKKIDVVSKDKRLLIIAVHCITNVSAESGVLEKGHHQLETLYAASH